MWCFAKKWIHKLIVEDKLRYSKSKVELRKITLGALNKCCFAKKQHFYLESTIRYLSMSMLALCISVQRYVSGVTI